eukprot:TRINITY_DN145_c0_g1_i2.p1 TRINITY_DN145_c0_g1~~TRINITY_DN145_c0_g1_i2.p1  ORF type:complete len:268 (-),score=67.30 TRINITY_DN145_c0_g1_i2:52-855(-)
MASQDFNFDLCARNDLLARTGMTAPGAMKTGTTIVGVTCKGGVVLGADTRATNGPIVADKNCEKIHYIADNIYCCGAGTAADTENTTELISSKLKLHKLATGRQPRVSTACTMLKQMLWRYGGHISAALVLGGVDINGSHLYTIYPHGSSDKLPYVTMGSGSLAAMSIFESEYKDDMEIDEAIALVTKAIAAGVFNDLGSGSNIDVTIITKDGADIRRNYVTPNERKHPAAVYYYPPGTTAVLSEKIVPIAQRKDIVVESVEKMDLA